MLSSEDMLRELELLPVWQLRSPAPAAQEASAPATTETVTPLTEEVTPEQVQPVAAMESEVVESGVVDATAVESVQVQPAPIEEQAQQPIFRFIKSDDGQWGFVLAPDSSQEAEALLQNMLKAVAVNVSQDDVEASVTQLNQETPSVIVVMGEAEAQRLLNTEQAFDQLRGKTHGYQQAAVIVTYSPSHLLLQWQDKAKAWEDLCLAKLTISNLLSSH